MSSNSQARITMASTSPQPLKAGGRYEGQLHDRGHETEEPEDRLQHQEGQGQEGGGGQALGLRAQVNPN